MAAISRTDNQLKAQEQFVDFSSANMFGLVCGVLILFAFIFMPWVGTRLQDNGARMMSDALVGPFPDFFTYEPLWIALVPIAALIAIGLALMGISNIDRGKQITQLMGAAGLVGLVYFVLVTLAGNPEAPVAANGAGIGFWVTLFAMIALVGQFVFTLPQVSDRFQNTSQSLGSFMPTIPRHWVPYMFLLAPLLLYLVWILLPTLYSFYLSVTNWDGVTAPQYVGLYNFERMFGFGQFAERGMNDDFRIALVNNARWLVVFITVPTTLGLGLALVFNNDMVGGRWYKVSFYSPLVLSYPVIGLVWSWIYNPRLGLLNSFLQTVGVESPPGWLADNELAIWCIIIAAVWRQVGYVMVLYLAGLKNIDPTLVEAAVVDGADRWNLFRRVIFPLLAPITTIIVVISIIDSLRAFDLVQIMTRGNTGTEVLANMMYMESFNNYAMGYGAAIAVVLFAISLVFIGFYLSRVVRDELEY
jgi:ABC-type sugar transport system permease subunit